MKVVRVEPFGYRWVLHLSCGCAVLVYADTEPTAKTHRCRRHEPAPVSARRRLFTRRKFLAASLGAAVGLLGCVKWGPTDHYHRVRTGMESVLLPTLGRFPICHGVYDGIIVQTGRWSESVVAPGLLGHADCLGDVHGAIEEARIANHLSEEDLRGLVSNVLLLDAQRFPCGKPVRDPFFRVKVFRMTDHCVSPDGAVFVRWWTAHASLKAAFADLREARETGREM